MALTIEWELAVHRWTRVCTTGKRQKGKAHAKIWRHKKVKYIEVSGEFKCGWTRVRGRDGMASSQGLRRCHTEEFG